MNLIVSPSGSDDTEAIQAAINQVSASGGGIVSLDAGTYTVSPNGTTGYCLTMPSNVALGGSGMGATRIVLATQARLARLLRVNGADCVIASLTLHGGTQNDTSEHRHGIFLDGAKDFQAERVRCEGFTGDGFYVYRNCARITLRDCVATRNGRNGVTLGAAAKDIHFAGGFYFDNRVTQIDSEPYAGDKVESVRIVGASLDCGSSNGIALTISGTSTAQGNGWSVVGNTVNGGMHQVWCNNVAIVGNHGTNATTKPFVSLYRKGKRLAVVGNAAECTQDAVDWVPALDACGTGTGDAPDQALFVGNAVKTARPASNGLRGQGVVSLVAVGNVLEGPGLAKPYAGGIYLRTTNVNEDMRGTVAVANYVKNFGAYGVAYAGNLTANHLAAVCTSNLLDDTAGSQTLAVKLDPSVQNFAGACTVCGNCKEVAK